MFTLSPLHFTLAENPYPLEFEIAFVVEGFNRLEETRRLEILSSLRGKGKKARSTALQRLALLLCGDGIKKRFNEIRGTKTPIWDGVAYQYSLGQLTAKEPLLQKYFLYLLEDMPRLRSRMRAPKYMTKVRTVKIAGNAVVPFIWNS